MFSYIIWKYSQEVKEVAYAADGSRSKNRFGLQFTLVFMIFLFASRGLAEYAGNLARQSYDNDILDRISLAKHVINVGEFKTLSADLTDVTLPGYVNLRQKLVDIKELDSHLRDVYLMVKKADWVYFAVDSLLYKDSDYRVPRLLYRNPPAALFDVFSNGNLQVIGPYSDEYGTFVSGYAAIRDVRSNTVVGVLGLDTDAVAMQTFIAKYRLVTFAFTLLLFLFLLVLLHFAIGPGELPKGLLPVKKV